MVNPFIENPAYTTTTYNWPSINKQVKENQNYLNDLIKDK